MEPQAKASEKREDSPDNTAPEQPNNDTAAPSSDPTARAEVPLPQTAKPAAPSNVGPQGVNSPPQDQGQGGLQGGPQSQGNPDEIVLFVSGFGYGLVDETFAALFTPFGKVISCKVLIDIPTGKSKGCGLIRLENKKAADAAMTALNGTTLPGQVTTLTVKFADTPEEKSRRRQRQLMNQRFNPMAPRPPMPYQMMPTPMAFPPNAYGAAAGGYQSYPAAAAGGAAGYQQQQQQSFQQLQAMQDAAAHATVQGQFTLYVGGLPQGVDEGSLYKMFSPYGAVAGVKVVMDQQNPTMNRGFAFVNFVRRHSPSLVNDALQFRYEEACQAIYALSNQQFGEKRLQVSFKTAPKPKPGMPGMGGPRAPGAATGGYTGPAAAGAGAYGAGYQQQAAGYAAAGYPQQQQYAAQAAGAGYGAAAAATTAAASYQQYPYGGSYQ